MKRYISIIFTLVLGISSVFPVLGNTPLISDVSQLETNAPNPAYPIEHLLDDDLNSVFLTSNDSISAQHYLSVQFPQDFSMEAGENLVVVLTRPNRFDPNTPTVRNPTAMEVHYSLDGENWEDSVLCRVYFINRGSGTTELSEPLPYAELNKRIDAISTGKTINDVKALKFIVTMNNGKYIIGNGIRPMILAGFQIYKVKSGEKVVGNWVDRFHLDSDINYRYYDYEFIHTQGPLHPANRNGYGENDEGTLESLGGWKNFSSGDNPIWTADSAYLSKHGISMPDYSFITAENDSLLNKDIKGLKLQRTATIEHVVYAVQGEPIALQPFYTLPDKASYEEKFIHWYDYTTGGQVEDGNHTELLNFAVDASGVFRSKDHGWFTSPILSMDGKRTYEENISIRTVDDYKKFVDKVNKEGCIYLEAELLEDLDFGGATVSPIGTQTTPWRGKFIGNNKTISNLKIDHTTTIGAGIFGSVAGGALIENLIIDSSCTINGAGWTGFVGQFRHGGTLTLQGVVNHANITATGNVGGLLGGVESQTPNDVTLNISNCAFTGKITNNKSSEQGLVAGWLGRGSSNKDKLKITVNFKNIIVSGSHNKPNTEYEIYRYRTDFPDNYIFNVDTETCYEVHGWQGWSKFTPTEVNTESFLSKLNGEWLSGSNGFPISKPFGTEMGEGKWTVSGGVNPDRKYGTFATFMHPRDPFASSGNLRGLCKDEFIIAADMAQGFTLSSNVDDNNRTIIEPIIQFRHIFRVKDGKKFADENMADSLGNRSFIRKNLRHITATAKTDFQVRLDYPYPVEPTTRGVFYYKINDEDYRRICSRFFRVWKDGKLIQDRDSVTGHLWVDSPDNLITDVKDYEKKAYFYATASFPGQGVREVDGINYYLCGGGGNFYRMMACNADKALEGRYKVQVVGTDYDGETIKLADGSNLDLLVQEFQITFLPAKSAVLATEYELENNIDYKDISNKKLEERYGKPSDKIDFDEYRFLENADSLPSRNPKLYLTEIASKDTLVDQTGKYFRWPLSWEQSNYGFGYNKRNDYAMQMIVNNQAITPYHSLPIRADNEMNHGEGPGLFDRLFYDTGGKQKGYFYYVNAADDPGIIARLKLDTFCPGSKIHISCWISEFSHSEESANLSFNFVARLKNGERIPLHSHITGYVEQGPKKDAEYTRRGRWLYVYSSFVPILTDKDFDVSQLSHYEVELDNNAKSSQGADYAVDDIRVYTVQPIVYADQLSLVCMESSSIDVRLSSDFEVLLQSLDIEETENVAEADTIDLYYTFLDKKKYDDLSADENVTYQEAFNRSVLRFKYDGKNESYFGKLQFFTCFDKHDVYDPSSSHAANYAFRMDDGRRLIVFNTDPTDRTMQSGKEYIAVLLTKPEGTTFEHGDPDAMDFLVDNKCTKKCTFTVQAAHSVKIDGEVRKQSDEIDACRNQMPVVQVDLYGQKVDENGDPIPGETELIEENAVFDWFDGSMNEFVGIEENGVSLWDALIAFRKEYPDDTDLSSEPKGDYTDAMKDIIARYSAVDPEGKIRPRLFLAQFSYLFPPLELPVGQSKKDAYVLAVPIPRELDGNRLICTQPTQVHIVVRLRAPRLAQGITSIEYPEAIDDVPLRVSLKRLEAAQNGSDPLFLPFRLVNPVSENVTDMRLPGGGSAICLAGTNDPGYKDLSGEGKMEDELWAVGEVMTLEANKDHVEEGKVALKFYPNIKFREGFEYRLRFLFEESTPQGTDVSETCTGHVVFTLKVVPEYQKWTGAENLNWNNDANWRRVAAADILADNPYDVKYTDHVTDGSSDRSFSYAPLNFTKVVIPKGASVPELYETESKSALMYGQSYDWNNNPSVGGNVGDATELVQYDMVQRVEDNVAGTYCKPWQAHWCDEIHFESGAEIGHQEHLRYNKAWVDMEVSPSRWYTLSSPLQGVVAGDMYLPTANARQSTTYFNDITFDSKENNRFKPAVFQRSWNLASAIVFNYNNTPTDTTDVKVVTTWSNVYNDVRVPYSAGHGFSIKTDLAGVGADKVKFRLPKADTYYDYYTDGGETGDRTEIKRVNRHKLNPSEGTFTIVAATDTNTVFLVGNPFMAHLDVAAFLSANIDSISPKYWILDGDHQGAAVMGDASDLTGTLDNPRYIAPMQGFFVEAKTPRKSLTLKYDAGMTATVNDIDTLASVITRGSAAGDCLRITARESGSSAMIVFNGSADRRYRANEDVMLVSDATLGSQSLVYTVADGTATTINTLPEIISTEVGVISANGGETTLVFDGVDTSLGLKLYDTDDDSYTDLYDGMEVTVDGSASRRLYIVSGMTTETVSELEIILMSDAVRITSTEGDLTATVYDISGRVVDSYTDGGTEAMFNLPKGIYIIEATDATSRKTKKVMI